MLAQIENAVREQEVAAEQAQASEQRMRRFVADASHELRTPLTSIRGFAELYRQGAVSDPQALDASMGRIEDEATRMGLLVDDMLLLARLDQKRPLQQTPVDLRPLATDVVARGAALAPDHVLSLQLPTRGHERGRHRRRGTAAAGPVEPGRQCAEPYPRGDNGGSRGRADDTEVHLAVSDDGPGMSEADAAAGLRALLPRGLLTEPLVGARVRQRSRHVDRRRPGRGARRSGRPETPPR